MTNLTKQDIPFEWTVQCQASFEMLKGKTPLITMDINYGDSPPVCKKPYTLPLKHREWV